MPGSERQQVVDAAKYLRGVRPLDPDELSEYVAGGAHPAVVARILREEAVALDLVERANGTFAPVPDETLTPDFDGVGRFPEAYADAFEARLLDAYGRDWHAGDTGDAIRERIRRLKTDYYWRNDVAYDADVAMAYACYHLPDAYAAVAYALHELGRDGLLDRRLRVLDVGAGVGGPALAVNDYVLGGPGDPEREALVEYHAVEPSDAATVFGDLVDETGPNFHPELHREVAEEFAPEGEYDLILFANVLNELDAPADTAARYLDALAPDGTMLAVAPADRETSTGLRGVEREIADERDAATIHAPMPRFWPNQRPTDRGWSFDERPDLEPPAFQQRLASGAEDPGAYLRTAVRYSWTALRTDGRRRFDMRLDRSTAAPLGESERHVTERVDHVVAKASHDLSESEGHPLYKVSDGSEDTEHYAVLVNETALNRLLADAGYGDPMRIENALTLWNDDEEAYNLVVDEEAVVDPA
ncbi:MAG: methyltransferase domain-containing protein [Halobacteriaceae archaeon]